MLDVKILPVRLMFFVCKHCLLSYFPLLLLVNLYSRMIVGNIKMHSGDFSTLVGLFCLCKRLWNL